MKHISSAEGSWMSFFAAAMVEVHLLLRIELAHPVQEHGDVLFGRLLKKRIHEFFHHAGEQVAASEMSARERCKECPRVNGKELLTLSVDNLTSLATKGLYNSKSLNRASRRISPTRILQRRSG